MGDAEGSRGLGEPVFFLDENHCRNPHMLGAFGAGGAEVQRLLDHFAPGTPDAEWIPEIAMRGWFLVTADASIRRNQLEREAVRRHRLGMFYFSRNNLLGVETGRAIGRALQAMRLVCATVRPPFAASISRSGEVVVRDRFDGPVI